MGLDLSADKELVTMELDLNDKEMFIANLFISEGRRREREEIIAALMSLENVTCCCDSSTFGNHYLSHKQSDNLIDLINQRKIG